MDCNTSRISENSLNVILNDGPWRLSRVTLMYRLLYCYKNLKIYSRKICKQLYESDVAKNSRLGFYVFVEILPTLRYSRNDAMPIMITVLSKGNGMLKKVYRAILLSWGFSVNIHSTVHLPHMLESGDENIGHEVKSILQKQFCCNIIAHNFSAVQLLLFGLNFATNFSAMSTDSLHLTYKLRPYFPTDLKFFIAIREVYVIWDRLRKVCEDEHNVINNVYSILKERHCFYSIDLDTLDCLYVNVPDAEVTKCGVVKMRSPHAVKAVFKVLNYLESLLI